MGLVVPLFPALRGDTCAGERPLSCLPLPFSARGLLAAGAAASAWPALKGCALAVCRLLWLDVALGLASPQEEDVPLLHPQKRLFQPGLGPPSRAHVGGRSRAQFPI